MAFTDVVANVHAISTSVASVATGVAVIGSRLDTIGQGVDRVATLVQALRDQIATGVAVDPADLQALQDETAAISSQLASIQTVEDGVADVASQITSRVAAI